ncbi:MAG: hypothetical protein U0U67_05460 [Chitinophagales bacterium]
MLRTVVCILSIIIFVSCVGQKKSLVGTYSRSGKGLNNYNELILDSNHTFKFSGHNCQGMYGAEGTWSRLGSKLILNTFPIVRIINDSVSTVLERKTINDNDSITFEMIDDSLELLIGVNVEGFIKNELKGGTVSNMDGIAKLKYEKYDSIVISYLGYSNLMFKANDSINYYKIKMRADNNFLEENYNSSVQFVNETWSISRKSYIHHRLKRVVRRVVFIDPRFKKHKKSNAYIFRKPKK